MQPTYPIPAYAITVYSAERVMNSVDALSREERAMCVAMLTVEKNLFHAVSLDSYVTSRQIS